MNDYEKLGWFYLGRGVEGAETGKEPLLYASKDLTTHAVVVGMTGSGKTGLAVALLEEAAIDGVPAIVIDPKGDLGNLLLTFPQLQAGDFEPWIDPDEAARKGKSVPEYAAATAQTWSDGLASWDQDGARIARFREAVDIAVYTPGSSAGLPLALLRSFAVPTGADAETLRERVATSVSSLLALVGIEADPMRSREHVLLSRILGDAWAAGQDLDLASLIPAIQKPAFDKIGVLDLESFYSAKERFGLAMALNALLASPSAAAWSEGEPLDIGKLLYTAAGKPRISVLSIAHLSDSERMFFVSNVLSEMVAWMRRQSGTSSLRAVLFMDEIAGYFPPTANPPSKPPMLTLLKQARAFGVGVVLATQNPVDLDYKGLSNCGTWFVGRLQTERDKARLLDGLEGVGARRADVDTMLSSLGNRVFLLHDVHRGAPVRFQSRWCLSYLRGPLSRDQLQRLQAGRARAPTAPTPVVVTAATRPIPPVGLEEVFVGTGATRVARVYAAAKVHYVDAKLGVDLWEQVAVVAPVEDTVDWQAAEPAGALVPGGDAEFGELPAGVSRKGAAAEWKKGAAAWIYAHRTLETYQCPTLKLAARPGETVGDFRARLGLAGREARDAAVAALQAKAAPKLAALEERQRKAEARVDKEKAQASAATMNAALSFGSTLLGALFGKKTFSASNVSKATTAAKSATRTMKERGDIGAAEEDVEAVAAARAALEAELAAEAEAIGTRLANPEVVRASVPARKSDILIERIALGWVAV